jgi:hypothetical protein
MARAKGTEGEQTADRTPSLPPVSLLPVKRSAVQRRQVEGVTLGNVERGFSVSARPDGGFVVSVSVPDLFERLDNRALKVKPTARNLRPGFVDDRGGLGLFAGTDLSQVEFLPEEVRPALTVEAILDPSGAVTTVSVQNRNFVSRGNYALSEVANPLPGHEQLFDSAFAMLRARLERRLETGDLADVLSGFDERRLLGSLPPMDIDEVVAAALDDELARLVDEAFTGKFQHGDMIFREREPYAMPADGDGRMPPTHELLTPWTYGLQFADGRLVRAASPLSDPTSLVNVVQARAAQGRSPLFTSTMLRNAQERLEEVGREVHAVLMPQLRSDPAPFLLALDRSALVVEALKQRTPLTEVTQPEFEGSERDRPAAQASRPTVVTVPVDATIHHHPSLMSVHPGRLRRDPEGILKQWAGAAQLKVAYTSRAIGRMASPIFEAALMTPSDEVVVSTRGASGTSDRDAKKNAARSLVELVDQSTVLDDYLYRAEQGLNGAGGVQAAVKGEPLAFRPVHELVL